MPSEFFMSGRCCIRASSLRAQRGVTLIELMVGITLGLLVVATAMAALMVSRGVSGTVSDASNMQQQAAYALRVIGGQLRQAGLLKLAVVDTSLAADDPAATHAFEVAALDSPESDFNFDLDQPQTLLSGVDGGGAEADTLSVGFRRYQDHVFANPAGSGAAYVTLARNCLGGPGESDGHQLVQSVFSVALDPKTGVPQLYCAGNSATRQAIVENVADFQIRYLVQDVSAPGVPKLRYLLAASVTHWAAVQGVEVCLALYGDERIDMPTGSTYTGCDGNGDGVPDVIDMTGAALPEARRNRMHLVFRNVFQLRSMGVSAS
ncbi:MAG: PilW family protein [Burkholderiaceae bacterium]|jgi:type IV pilus assembly protein PilW|nr:PilW family protein [Burkholderiaceae bacterium]